MCRAITSPPAHVPEPIATSARLPPRDSLDSSITCRAVINSYPSGLASSKTPAPKPFDGISLREFHVRRAGLITATNGFNCSETSLAVMGVNEGREGKLILVSSSFKLPLTIAGRGTNETASTAAIEVNIPLIVRSGKKRHPGKTGARRQTAHGHSHHQRDQAKNRQYKHQRAHSHAGPHRNWRRKFGLKTSWLIWRRGRCLRNLPRPDNNFFHATRSQNEVEKFLIIKNFLIIK